MGQEISSTGFTHADFAAFSARLEEETRHLRACHAGGGCSSNGPVVGIELEAWLIDHSGFPAPHNQDFLKRLKDPFVVAELARFNIELNAPPSPLAGDGLLQMETQLRASWERCDTTAHEDVDTMVAIGILPSLRESDLVVENMTPSNRYVALNQEVLKSRKGKPLRIEIDCADPDDEPLKTTHDNVTIEAATTSFQLHLQVPPERISPILNASLILSAPLIALSANSPFLFGHRLWHETRIPLFEQAVQQEDGSRQRVTFGSGYLGPDPTAIFQRNLELFPPLLPIAAEDPIEEYPCLRLHNGTIWRWNRPLVGFDDDGTPHMRIEQRVMPSGPTAIDMFANAAFYYGTAFKLAQMCEDPEAVMPFERARTNFYTAAKYGLDAHIDWLDGTRRNVTEVALSLLPMARDGLEAQDVDAQLIERYMDVLHARLASRQNGAAWQLAHYAKHGDLLKLTADYLEHQRESNPVHEWAVG